MATPANIIPVPKPSGNAFNPDRPLSRNALVQAQVKHFEEADRNLPPDLQTGMDINSITTEGQAAAYIRKVTEAIHKTGGRAGKVQRAG
jgi:hypothetical protein